MVSYEGCSTIKCEHCDECVIEEEEEEGGREPPQFETLSHVATLSGGHNSPGCCSVPPVGYFSRLGILKSQPTSISYHWLLCKLLSMESWEISLTFDEICQLLSL